MNKQEIIEKWTPVFIYGIMLAPQCSEFLKEVSDNNIDIEEVFYEIFKNTFHK
jgi:glutaredoxin-related protein